MPTNNNNNNTNAAAIVGNLLITRTAPAHAKFIGDGRAAMNSRLAAETDSIRRDVETLATLSPIAIGNLLDSFGNVSHDPDAGSELHSRMNEIMNRHGIDSDSGMILYWTALRLRRSRFVPAENNSTGYVRAAAAAIAAA